MNITKNELVKLKLRYGYDFLISLSPIEGVEFLKTGGFHYRLGNLMFFYSDFNTCKGIKFGKFVDSVEEFMKIYTHDLNTGLSHEFNVLNRQIIVSNFHNLVLVFSGHQIKVGYVFSNIVTKVSSENNSISLKVGRDNLFLIDIDTYALYSI